MTDRRVVWIILVAATTLRLVLAARIPLVDDEAYYWTWSQRLAWGYPDHPPAIAALIRLTTTVLGNEPLAVRAGPILLNLGIALLLYSLGAKMFTPDIGALAALWFQTIPLLSVGGILSFPDAPFIFFWLLAMWALWQARAPGGGFIWWLVAGAAVGLAALSKLATLFLGIAATGYLGWGERERRWWRHLEPYAAFAAVVTLTAPMLQWNATHGGIMLTKARDPYAWINTGVPALNALAYIGGQLMYYGPVSAGLLVAALVAAWRGTRAREPRYIYLVWMAVPILGVFAAMSFDGVAKPHWAAPAYLIALLPAAALWTDLRHRRPWRRVVAVAVAVNIFLVGALGALALWPGNPTSRELRAWPSVVARLQALIDATPSAPGRFLLVPDYQTAAQIEYHLRGTVVATPFGFDAYDVWVPHQRLIDWNAVYITAGAAVPGLPLPRLFQRVETLPSIPFAAEGQPLRSFAVYRGFGYRGRQRPVARAI